LQPVAPGTGSGVSVGTRRPPLGVLVSIETSDPHPKLRLQDVFYTRNALFM
jgi:hypothetical protein